MSKTARKVLSIILTVIMTFSAFPMTAVVSFAEEPETPSDCEHSYVCTDYSEKGHNLKCEYCEETLYADHNVSITKHTDPSCVADGCDLYSCDACDYSYEEYTDAIPHSYELDDWDEDYEYKICSECGDCESVSHEYEKTKSVAATCDKSGYDILVCKNCGFSIKSNYCSVDHDYDKTTPYKTYEGSCTSASYVVYKCKNCDATITEDYVAEKGHNYVIISETKATCDSEGVTLFKCNVCGDEDKYVAPKLGHEFVATGEKTEATCLEDGIILKKCKNCGKTNKEYYDTFTISKETLDYYQSEHNYDNSLGNHSDYTEYPEYFVEGKNLWSFKADPLVTQITITFDERSYLENNCDYIYIYDKDLNCIYSGSSFGSYTYTIPGNEFYIALTTDISVTYWGFALTSIDLNVTPPDDERIPALGHNFTDGKCSRCGIAEYNIYLTYTDSEGKTVSDGYSSLDSAVYDAGRLSADANAVITVTKDLTITQSIYFKGNVTLDFGDSNITLKKANLTVESAASLTLKGKDGSISSDNNTLLMSYGNLVIEGGNYSTGAWCVCQYSGNVVIKGGNFSSTYSQVVQSSGTSATASLNISGGKFTSENNPAIVISGSGLTISGGEFKGTYALSTSDGKVTISGGTFNGEERAISISSSTKYDISGGTFITENKSFIAGQNTPVFNTGLVAYVVDSDGKVTEELAKFKSGNVEGSFTVTSHKKHTFTTPVCDICGAYDSLIVTDTTVAIVTIGNSVNSFTSLADALNYAAINPKSVLTIVAEKVDLDADVTIDNSACDFTIIATNSVISGISETGTNYYLTIKSGKVVFQGTLAGINCLVMKNGNYINSLTEPGYIFAVNGITVKDTTETDSMYSIIEHSYAYHTFEDGVCKYCEAKAAIKATQGSDTYYYTDLDEFNTALKMHTFFMGLITVILGADDMSGKTIETSGYSLRFNFGQYKTNCNFYISGGEVYFYGTTGGIQTESDYAIQISSYSQVAIISGVYEGKLSAVDAYSAGVVIAGGTYKAGSDGSIISTNSNMTTHRGIVGEDTDGTILVNGNASFDKITKTITFKEHTTHTFEGPTCKYCGASDSAIPEKAVASVYTDKKLTYYTTVEAALTAASGKTALITLLDSVKAENGIVIDNKDTNITINLNGYDFCGNNDKPIVVKSGKIHFYGDGIVSIITLENGQTVNTTAAPGYMAYSYYIPDGNQYTYYDDKDVSTTTTPLRFTECIHPFATETESGALCKMCGEKMVAKYECDYNTVYLSSLENIPSNYSYTLTLLSDVKADKIAFNAYSYIDLELGKYTITANSITYPDSVDVSATTGGIHTKDSPAIDTEYAEITGGVYTSDSCEAIISKEVYIMNAKLVSGGESPAISTSDKCSPFIPGYYATDSTGKDITPVEGKYYGLKKDNTVIVSVHTNHIFDDDGVCYCGSVNEETGVIAVIIGESTSYYDNIYDAFSAASGSNGATVKLIDNVTYNISDRYPYMDCAENLTFDLNGKTITGNNNMGFNNSTVTITGNGTVNVTQSSCFYQNGSYITIENGTYTATTSSIVYCYHTQGLTINGGSFNSSYETVAVYNSDGFVLIVNDGSFVSRDELLELEYSKDAEVTINGGDFDVKYDLVYTYGIDNADIVINDCVVNVSCNVNYDEEDYYGAIWISCSKDVSVEINDCEITNQGYILVTDESIDTSIEVNGGKYNGYSLLCNSSSEGTELKIKDAEVKCRDSLIISDKETEDEDNELSFVNGVKATVNGGKYETSGLINGYYCVLDITKGSFVVNDANQNACKSIITISGGDFTADYGNIIYVFKTGLTITGGTFNSKNGHAIAANYSEATISGGTFNALTEALYSDNSKVTITGGTFNGKGITVCNWESDSVISGGTFNAVKGGAPVNALLKSGYVYKGSTQSYGVNFDGENIYEKVTVVKCDRHQYKDGKCIYCKATGEGKIALEVDGTVKYFSTIYEAASALEKSTDAKKATIYINSYDNTYNEKPININAPGCDVNIVINEPGTLATTFVIMAGNVEFEAANVEIYGVEVKKGAKAELCSGTYNKLSVEDGSLAGLLCHETVLCDSSTNNVAVSINTKDKATTSPVYVQKCGDHRYLDSTICSFCGKGAVAKVEYDGIITPYYFSDLETAIDCAMSEESVITLLADCEIGSINYSDYSFSTYITLDLGEYTLTVDNDIDISGIELIIKSDGGILRCDEIYTYQTALGIEDVTVYTYDIEVDNAYLYFENVNMRLDQGIHADFSLIEMVNSDITSLHSDLLYAYECGIDIDGGRYESKSANALDLNESECYIKDGEFITTQNSVVVAEDSELTLCGGTFNSDYYVFSFNSGSLPEFLADGYLYKDGNGKINNTFNNEITVTVVKCMHENGKAVAGSKDTHTVFCKTCGMEKEKESCIYEVTEVVPNCESQGSITYTCKICGNSYTGDYSEESGHEEAEPTQVITTEATCTTEGKAYDVIYCSKCEKELSRGEEYSIPATGHTKSAAVKENEKAATCTKAGSYDTVVYCSVCNEEVSRKTTSVPATGHKDANKDGKCDVCKTVLSDNSCKNAKINVAAAKSVNYRSKVTIKATATGVGKGYFLAIYVGDKQVAKAESDGKSTTEVTYNAGELKGNIEYTVKVVDAKGNVQKDANNKDLVKDGGKITCKAGFFQKLIAFFKGLFGSLPTVTIKP